MFLLHPYSDSLFQPRFHSSPVAYWLIHPGSENNDDQTVSVSNKQQESDKPENGEQKDKEKTYRHLFLNDFEAVEEDDHVLLATDLPGIKHADLRVEFRDGALHVEGWRKKSTKKQSFVRRLALNEDAIDIQNITATLADGVLTVKAPKALAKKAPEKETGDSRKVVVSKSPPPEEAIEMNMEIDMPGVKVEDLDIVLAKNGTLSVSAERKTGSSQNKKRTEAFMVNKRKVDTGKLEAYLNDGVLTIRAPAKAQLVKTVAVNGQLPEIPKGLEEKVEEDSKEKVA